MEFGLFSNDRRPTRSLGESWDLDIEEIVVADEAGFHEAWISEHQAIADLIICRAAALTRTIRLGSAVRVLPAYHPVQVATDAAACDQLTHGRYLLGVGPGFLPKRLVQRGIAAEEMRPRSEESLELLMKLLAAKEPIDIEGKFYRAKGAELEIPFVQQPHVPVALSVANSTASAATAGRLGLLMITPDFISARKLRGFGDALEEAQRAAGRPARRDVIRACRVVYVADTDKAARDDMRESYTGVIKWEIVNTPWHQEDRIPPGGALEDITFDGLVDSGNLFIGAPDTVRQMIEAYFAETGGFGTLMVHCARDYATHEKVLASMRLFMRAVAPRVSRLQPGSTAPVAAQ
jgi:limonene 1,2-monooxygenase